jgi:hypothetical protein
LSQYFNSLLEAIREHSIPAINTDSLFTISVHTEKKYVTFHEINDSSDEFIVPHRDEDLVEKKSILSTETLESIKSKGGQWVNFWIYYVDGKRSKVLEQRRGGQ